MDMSKKICKINNTYNNNTNIDVLSGEICTIDVSKNFGIFGNTEYFNSNVSNKDKGLINKYIDNISDKNAIYSLCNPDYNTSNIYYKNCVLTTNNPWLSMDKTKTVCSIPEDITIPDIFKYDINDKNTIIKPNDIFKYKKSNELCKEKIL